MDGAAFGRQVKMVFDENLYLNQMDCVVDVRLGKTIKAQYGVRYYFTSEEPALRILQRRL